MRIEPGQVAVITGGASGIGFGFAEALMSRGVNVVLADIREEALTAAAGRLAGHGASVHTVPTDVSDMQSVQHLADLTVDTFGRVDLLFNNAGVVSPQRPMWEQDESTWTRMINVKVMGVVNGVRAFAPLLINRSAGHFINTASSGGLMALPNLTPYNATMHAVVGVTETLDLELKAVSPTLGATVVCPGLVATDLGINSAALGAVVLPTGDGHPKTMEDAAKLYGGILTAREVAEATLDAVEADRVHAIIGQATFAAVRARAQSVTDDIIG